MKKLLCLLLMGCFVFCLSACNNQSGQEDNTLPPEINGNDSNILIAYFTWAENTVVENPDDVDVDASTSASVLVPGNTALMAQYIEEVTGGDVFSIIVEDPYSSDYNECLNRANREKAQNARPKLKASVHDMEKYDVVFLGFPNWWSTVPMAIHSFLESYNFEGKTVILFCTHGTSGIASCVRDIRSALPDITVLNALGIYRNDMGKAEETIKNWLYDLGFSNGNGEL